MSDTKRPLTVEELAELIKPHAPMLVEELLSKVKNKHKDSARAAEALLAYGFGHPRQQVEHSVAPKDVRQLSHAELLAIAGSHYAGTGGNGGSEKE